jgi:hypothetical protein
MPHLVPIGYLPKDSSIPNGWNDSSDVSEICSISGCVNSCPPDWLEHWVHNDYGYYNSEADALNICDQRPQLYHLYAYRMLAHIFESGVSSPFETPNFPVQPIPITYISLGFDVANGSPGRDILPFFGCSPLSCNGIAKEVKVNKFCLLPTLDMAIDLALRLSMGGAEPGPYFVIEVLRQSAA